MGRGPILAAHAVLLALLIACAVQPPHSSHGITAVAPGSPPVVMSGGSLFKLLIGNMSVYYAVAVREDAIVLAGSYDGHPALAILNASGGKALGEVAFLPRLKGALFSAFASGETLISAGYVGINGSYDGLLVMLQGRSVSAEEFRSPYPMYFRDAAEYGGRVVVAAAVAVSGRYYAGVALVNGSRCVITFLNPRVAGVEGFSVKALVRLSDAGAAGYGVAAVRGGRLYVIVAAGNVLRAFSLSGISRVFNAVPYHLRRFDELIVEGYPTSSVRFPSLNAVELPASTRYFLMSPNGTVTPVDSSFRILPKLGREFTVELVPSSLYGFTTATATASARAVGAVIKPVSASLVQAGPQTGSPPPATTSGWGKAGNSSSARKLAHGFSRAFAARRLNYVELGVGCALIFIAYLLRRVLS